MDTSLALQPRRVVISTSASYWARIVLSLLLSIASGVALAGAMQIHAFASEPAALPHVAPRPVLDSLFDMAPVPVTVTVAWRQFPRVVPAHQLLRDHTLWEAMHTGDWDGVPPAVRERALAAMTQRYAGVFEGPTVWRRMSAEEWDAIPQPLRAMAYLRMVWYWARYEQSGSEFGLAPSTVAATIGAIVMAESWFEHRAVNENAWGNRDLGLAQCSSLCRRVLGEMAAAGEIGFVLAEENYFDPWVGTRVATVWFTRELRRAGGDVDLAIRAYHRGLEAALAGEGENYAANVRRLRERYILNDGAPPTWDLLVRRVARL